MNNFENYAFPIISILPAVNKIDVTGDIGLILQGLENVGDNITEIDFVGYYKDKSISDLNANLDDGENKLLDDGIWDYGLECLAFYKSIHFLNQPPIPGKWGVFIFDFAINYLVKIFNSIYSNWPANSILFSDNHERFVAFLFLHHHELYHFYFDAWAISHEAITSQPLYANYHNLVYRPHHPSEICVEESLANRNALDVLIANKINNHFTNILKDFMAIQPGAYAKFNGEKAMLRGMLAAQLLYGPSSLVGVPRRSMHEQVPWIAYGRKALLNKNNCPIFKINDVRPSSFIVPKLGLPTPREFMIFVTNYLNGVPLSKTDHEYAKIDNGEKIKIPNVHKEKRIFINELSGTLLKAGMSFKDFRDERIRTQVWQKNVPRENIKKSRLKHKN